LGEDKTIKEALLEQLTELFAQCTWTMVRRHAKVDDYQVKEY
jgi:hypothetical protein